MVHETKYYDILGVSVIKYFCNIFLLLFTCRSNQKLLRVNLKKPTENLPWNITLIRILMPEINSKRYHMLVKCFHLSPVSYYNKYVHCSGLRSPGRPGQKTNLWRRRRASNQGGWWPRWWRRLQFPHGHLQHDVWWRHGWYGWGQAVKQN